ncbi:unnamed protein product [Ectocarpus sp. 12 AP-2014]
MWLLCFTTLTAAVVFSYVSPYSSLLMRKCTRAWHVLHLRSCNTVRSKLLLCGTVREGHVLCYPILGTFTVCAHDVHARLWALVSHSFLPGHCLFRVPSGLFTPVPPRLFCYWCNNDVKIWIRFEQGSETNLATAIADEADTDVNSSGVMSFKALAILAWILFAMQLFTTYWCCKARDVLLEVSWSAGHDYTQLPTRAGLHGNGNKFSSYQQAMDDEDLEAAANGDPGASLAHYL